jgi:hypothetical protein
MISLLLALLSAPVSAFASFDLPKENAVYNGTPVGPGGQGWKSTAKLWFGGGSCTGVFIARDLILTAAHCGQREALSELYITLYFENSANATQITVPEAEYKYFTHPGYVRPRGPDRGTNDLALIVLKGATLPDEFTPTEFLTAGDSALETAFIVGAGLTHKNEPSDRLYFTKGSITEYLPGDMMEVITTQGQGICAGDSGSPLFQPVGDSLKLSAITVSMVPNINKKCGRSVFATILTHSRYNWLMRVAEEGRAAE